MKYHKFSTLTCFKAKRKPFDTGPVSTFPWSDIFFMHFSSEQKGIRTRKLPISQVPTESNLSELLLISRLQPLPFPIDLLYS